MSDKLLDTSDRKAVERAMKNTTLKDIDESAKRTAEIRFEQENPIEVTIKKKPKKPKKKVNPGKGGKGNYKVNKEKGGKGNFARGGKVVKMKDGGFPDLTGDGKVTKADVLKGRGVFKKGGSVNKKKIIRAAKRGFGAAKRGF
tara:strand:- start:198 stop:626 length:429 start_codon:yes stop_codon:yes gene_type:complete